ncbi:DUF6153 family protein [Streptomyces sp. NPDC006332]|uniref:DUF6153 family protein n=1 Tax=Streptomyces sp. NPDC006332 TaxID=3155456 RepID=UPI00339DD649
MKSPEQHLAPPPVRPWRALLVLGLLAGLLAMHAMAPGGMGGHERAADMQRMTSVSVSAHGECAGDCGGGHLQHADPTCAAAAVRGTPSLPALLPDPVAVPERGDAVCAYAAEAPDSARAPPSLAELQLLRI